jgi:micrococcal nuclease
LLSSWRGVRLRERTGSLLRWSVEPFVWLRLMPRLWFSVLLLALLSPSLALAFTEYQGKVIRVMDGDTIEVLHNTRPERIRLRGIDCPEKGQAYGTRAKQAASALVFGKEVMLQTHGLDRYGRTIADVLLTAGTNVNHTMVKDGWCWWYRKYAPGHTELERFEKEAREAKKGLWAERAPIPPWVYRQARRGQAPDWLDMEAPQIEVVPLP